MRLPVVQHPGRTCDVEGDVGAPGDFFGSPHMPKGGPAREGPGGGGWVHGTEAGVLFYGLRALWFWEERRHHDLQGAGNVGAACQMDPL